MHRLTELEKGLWLAIILVAGWLAAYASPVVAPFLLAVLLAVMGHPLVAGLHRIGLPHGLAVSLITALIVLLLAALVFGLWPILIRQGTAFIADLLGDRAGGSAPPSSDPLLNLFTGEAADPGRVPLPAILPWSDIGPAFSVWLALVYLILIAIVLFYSLHGTRGLESRFEQHLPGQLDKTDRRILMRAIHRLRVFLCRQLPALLLLAALYGVALDRLGLEQGLFIGIAAGLLTMVPLLGFSLGVLAGSYLAWQVGSAGLLLGVWAVFVLGQLLSSLVLQPWAFRHHSGIHPVSLLLALLAGGYLMGAAGLCLAAPVAALLSAWWRDSLAEPDIPPTLTPERDLEEDPLPDIDESMRQEDA